MLKPVIYHREGRYLGYGLKFWPREAENVRQADERLKWTTEFTGKNAGSGTQDPTR